MKIWKENDRSKGICSKCKELGEIVFQRRPFYLKKTKKSVKDVLVGVCAICDEMVSVPPQSTARLKEARLAVRMPLEVRVPAYVKDIVLLVVDTLGATVPQSALAQLFRNYIIHMKEEPRTARYAFRLLKKSEYSKRVPSQDRISIKLSPELFEMKNELHSIFHSDVNLIRGIAALSKDEVLDRPDQARIKELRYSILQVA